MKMKKYAIHYGDKHGYMSSPLEAFAVVSAASLEEAVKELGIELVPGTRCIVPNDTIVKLIESIDKGYPFPDALEENLVLVEQE